MFKKNLYVLSVAALLSVVSVTAEAQQKVLPVPLKDQQGATVRSLDLAQADG